MKKNKTIRRAAIEGFPNHEILENGKVFNKKKGKYQTIRKIPGRTKTYLTVVLSHEGVSKQLYISHLVALAFVENPDNNNIVGFIDGDSTNVDHSNLKWTTQSDICKVGRTGIRKKKIKELIKV